MLSDVRIALRSFAKHPAFAIVVVLTAALGIGATTAIFSVVNAVLLRPLPYENSDRLVRVLNRNSLPDIDDWIEQNQTVEVFGAYGGWSADLLSGETPERIHGAVVTGELFPLLGVAPTRGRYLGPEDSVVGGAHVMVVSYDFWQRRLGGVSDVVGSTLSLSNNPTTIVGVMPEGFRLPGVDDGYWLPYRVVSPDASRARGVHSLIAVGRLADESTLAQAQADMDAIATRLEALYPNENTGRRFVLEPWREQLAADARPAILLLFGAVGMVLVLACSNVAALLLARMTKRHQEIALRSALGATDRRILRQLLVESVFLGVMGGVVGLALASVSLRLIAAFGPADVARLDEVTIDSTVLIFSLVVSVATGLLFGLAPAAQAKRLSLVDAMKQRGGQTGGMRRLRSAMIVSEIAIAVVLLVGAGLLFKSLYRLHQVDPGFRHEALLTLDFQLPLPEFGQIAERIAFFDAVLERLAALPGVEGVAAVTDLPFGSGSVTHNLAVEGQALAEGTEPEIFYRGISPNYFRVMGIPVIEGRDFTDADRYGSLPVAIVNETFVRELFPTSSPIGQRFRWARRDEVRWITIVGVVGDIKPSALDSDEVAAAYVPFRQEQDSWRSWMSVALRSSSDVDALVMPITRAVAGINANIPVANIQPMARLIASSSSERRFHLTLFGAFAAVALVIAAVGVYGLLSFLVAERTNELGIRLVLGASRGHVLRLVVQHGLSLTLIGLLVGSVAALGFARVLGGFLFEVEPSDPATFAIIALVLLAVAGAASFLPAHRASRVNPLDSIHYS